MDRQAPRAVAGFTLAEMMVSAAIMAMLMLILHGVIQQTFTTWKYTSQKIEAFREARQAFETLSRRVSQATLNTVWDYEYDTTNITPTRYIRFSELRFASGPTQTLLAGMSGNPRPTHGVFFQAPLGFSEDSRLQQLRSLLNTWGYYIEFNSDKNFKPSFVQTPDSYRFRLMEYMEPSEDLSVYKYISEVRTGGNPTFKWITDSFPSNPAHPLATNIVALSLLPHLSGEDDPTGVALCPNYIYRSDRPTVTNTKSGSDPMLNSKHQLPPLIKVTMVALDEGSASRLAANSPAGTMPDLGYSSSSGLFTKSAKFQEDMDALQLKLKGFNSRVFSTDIAIAGAKWSVEQTR